MTMIQPKNLNNDVVNHSTNTPSNTLRNLIYRKQWDKIEAECNCSPHQAKVSDKLGDLPLHEACLQAAPFHVIKNLIIAYPAGVKKKGFCSRIPLHYASYIKPSLNIIKLLLKNHPEGASTLDSDGRLPVHLAVVRNAPKEAILVLISAFPRSLKTPNKFGSTPLMLARNEHIQSMLLEEELRPRNAYQKMESVKRLKKVWNAPNAIVANKAKNITRPHTTGQILKVRRNLHNRTLDDSAKNMPTRNREIFKRGGGKEIPPPPGTVFESTRLSIPTPPGTPSTTRRSISSTNIVNAIFEIDHPYSQPYTRNTKVEQAIFA